MTEQLKELEQFNAHQESTRKRTEFIAKSIFLMSGGALTVSIGLFLRKEAPTIVGHHLPLLKGAWFAFFLSIVAYIIVFGLMVIRDYIFGERWRRRLQGEAVDVSGNPGWIDTLMWIFATLAVLSFVFGMGALAWVSIGTIGKTS